MSVLCVLPARLRSARISRKPLQVLAGRPLVEWSWRAARAIPCFDAVWVATDSDEIAERVRAFGGRAVLTSPAHASGSDRVAEVARLPQARGYRIVVNFQADEPFADADAVCRAVQAVREGRAPLATVAAPIRSESRWLSPSVVKVVVAADGRALYFSRAPIPHPTEGRRRPPDGGPGPRGTSPCFLRHVGVYVMSREGMERWTEAPPSPLEEVEKLEQLRALEAGLAMVVVVGSATEPGVDEPEDLERVARLLARPGARRAVPELATRTMERTPSDEESHV